MGTPHKNYIYAGNRDSTNTAREISYTDPEEGSEPQGTVRDAGDVPTIAVGEEIRLTAAERDRLASYIVLLDKEGDDVAAGTPPASVIDPAPAPGDPAATSDPEGTISEEKSTSASTSKKSS